MAGFGAAGLLGVFIRYQVRLIHRLAVDSHLSVRWLSPLVAMTPENNPRTRQPVFALPNVLDQVDMCLTLPTDLAKHLVTLQISDPALLA